MPRTVMELRVFLVAVNVYRRFIPNYAKLAAPLNVLLKNLPQGIGKSSKLPVVLDGEALAAFKKLVDEMCSLRVLALPVTD